MAIYHLHCDCVGRSKGKTSVGASAYRSCEKLKNETDGLTHDYTHKKGLLHKEILAPDGVPEWAKKRQSLWNEVEKKENRKNSVFAKDIDVALQKELSLEDNIDCLRQLIQKNCTEKGLVTDLCIHAPHRDRNGVSNENIHAHLLITTRQLTEDGWGKKAWSKLKDEHEWLDTVRTDWADIVNQKFAARGINERIDERTLEAQGIDREPQQHQGATATAMERKGKTADRQKYTPAPKITVTNQELTQALEKNNEYQNLLQLEKTEISAQEEIFFWANKIANTPDKKQAFAAAYKNLHAREMFYYIRENPQEEIDYWRKIRSPGSEPFNQHLRQNIEIVKDVVNYPEEKPNEDMLDKCSAYYTDYQNRFTSLYDFSRWQKFRNWCQTTEFPPVKIIRTVYNTVKSWSQIHHNQSKTHYQGRTIGDD